MTRYFVEFETVGEEGVRRAFGALLDLLADHLVRAQIDAIPCHPPVAEEARPALERLTALALAAHEQRHRGSLMQRVSALFSTDPLMAVSLDLRVDEQRDLLRAFGPHSIHAEVYGEGGRDLISTHDCGWVIDFEGEPGLAAQVAAAAGIPRGAVGELP